jgi:ketosteroid isomerase-like protein
VYRLGSDEEKVLSLNEAFYAAFRDRDFVRMDEIWSAKRTVAVIHPGWPPLHGREAVMESWEGILGSPSSPEVFCAEARAYVIDHVAFVICTEQLVGGELVATNVFARENGEWKMVHHQAGPIPPSSENEFSEMIH